MSDLGQSDLGQLRASLARARRELDAAHARLDALETSRNGQTKTALVPRVIERQRRQMILVGACSSAATAILLGLAALVFSPSPSPPAPPRVVASPLPPPITPDIPPPPPPPVSVAVPEPPAPPVVAEPPPRPPRRVSPPLAAKEEAPKRARPEDAEMGSLSIICLPMRCDSIIDNGTALGPGHIFTRPVPVGRHQLTLHTPNGVTKNLRVDIHADQLKEVRVMMQDASDVF